MVLAPPDRTIMSDALDKFKNALNQCRTRFSGRAFIVMALTLSALSPSMAGDYSQANIIGYSSNFRFLAFEEFGIEDGSGFAYSNYYLIDLQAEPVKIVEQTEHKFDREDDPSIEDLVLIRTQAREKAQSWIEKANALWPAQLLAYNGDGVPKNYELKSDAGLKLRFGAPGYNGAVIGDYTLSLGFTEVQTPNSCMEWNVSKPLGFVLSLTDNDYEKTRDVYRTHGLPAEYTCPLNFTISGIYAPFESYDISNAIALISIYSQGFEGLDRRFMVVPIAP